MVAVKKFSSGIESIDFCNSSESARVMNSFVEEKTRGKIKNIIEAKSLNCRSSVVLINAIHFKGNWLYKFDEKLTTQDVFYVDEIDSIYADFMQIKKYFTVLHLDELDARALELKYDNSKFSFVILLPNDYSGLAALESRLTNHDLMKDFKRFDTASSRPEVIVVKIPKFSVVYEMELNKILKIVSV